MGAIQTSCGDFLGKYRKSVMTDGLAETWESIIDRVKKTGETEFLNVGTFGRLYEDGLAVRDAVAKKRTGKYYTPSDVASVMAEWLDRLPGTEVCDVACGTGNLILSYLDRVEREYAVWLVEGGHVHLYDIDETAIRICAFSIGLKYGFEAAKGLNVHIGDFLQDGVELPADCKVVSNPPYGPMNLRDKEERCGPYAAYTPNGDLYAAFMGKGAEIWMPGRSSDSAELPRWKQVRHVEAKHGMPRRVLGVVRQRSGFHLQWTQDGDLQHELVEFDEGRHHGGGYCRREGRIQGFSASAVQIG